MTREELNEALKMIKKQIEDTVGNRLAGQDYTIIGNVGPDNFTFILDAAIKELQKEPEKICVATVKLDESQLRDIARKAAENIKKELERPQPCNDAISRSEALRAFWNGEAFPRYLEIAPPVKPKKTEETK